MPIRRTPFTAGVIAVLLIAGLVTGALFTRVSDLPWGNDIAYGLPALTEGRMWTLGTGALFAVTPLCYVAVIGSFALLAGFAERRLGTARTVVACVYGHLAGVLGAAGLIAAGLGDRWLHSLDVGFSAGAMAAAAIASATLARPWRRLARLALITYCVGAIVVLGQLADVEHLVAVLCGLPAGRFFVRHGTPDVAAADRARALLARYGGGSLSWMTTWGRTRYLLSSAGDGYLAYRRHAGVAITVGDPVGSPAWRSRAIAEFAAFCDRSGLLPCGFSVGSSTVDSARALGWRHVQVAEDTLVDLAGLEFRGKSWQDVRTARNRAAREGIEHRMITLADAPPSIVAQVREVSRGWLRGKRTPELGFTLGGVTEALDPRVRVGIAVDATGLVHAVTSWLPILDATGHPRGWTLDMMRRRPDGFPLAIDFLIASACLVFQSEGAAVVSLSGAPLARSTGDGGGPLQRLLDGLGRIMEPCYGFRSLHAYKSKFKPRREPLHLTYPSPTALPRIGIAVLRAYLASSRRPVSAPPRPIAIPAPRAPRPVVAGHATSVS
ncbi:MAG TPA: DUF2156 domain-containing protein [Actinophytocola sp.]|uniref:bifunctional lysylphosphatidylglycerol flippase/synthetase MprF n=1 Tax=Actinophytocola sp. TaxID=1872138 RepID=UPI002DDCF866|nr:DUF2156 domain-containing protein [Actinophytocola sp.]HEV2783129.1 DUF2156 domain-containing protein [Actinophytocola sp.]